MRQIPILGSLGRLFAETSPVTGLDLQPLAKDQRLATLRLPTPGTPMSPAEAKALAELVALKGLGKVAPNPLVGAVIVDELHAFVAAGAHEQIGGRHAEIQALDAAEAMGLSGKVKGGSLYVTLEPCAHHNLTPPCAPRVGASGVARVVYGVRDPNPLVDGKGAAILAAYHVACVHDQGWEPACRELAEVFLWNFEEHRPFVALKVATSLDGVMARRGDRRAFLTGPRARAYGHFLRCYYDAIVIGRTTLVQDDPTLDPRDALVPGRMPRRVVLDPRGAGLKEVDLDRLNLLKAAPETVIWVLSPGAASKTALEFRGAKVLELPVDARGRFTPGVLLDALALEGVTSLLLEGGAGLYSSFLAEGAVQRLHHFQAPLTLGGGGDPLHFSAASPTLESDGPVKVTPLGPDLLLETRLRKR